VPSCCDPRAYERLFDAAAARRDAARYRRKGLGDPAGRLLGFLRGRVAGATVLEAGGGVGDLGIELLRAGAAHATNVELARTYEDEARALIAERGLAERVTREIGDFAVLAGEPADVVVLNRVLCCYPDARAILRAAAARARTLVALSLPRDDWWMRLGAALCNPVASLRYRGWRFEVHPLALVRGELADAGFREAATHQGLVWRSFLFER